MTGLRPPCSSLSNHTADNWMYIHQYEDPGSGIYYPGYWGTFAAPSGDVQAWGIPGTSQAPGTHFSGWYYTKVRAWTGDFNSYAAAVAGGANFAESGAFTTHFGYTLNPTNVGNFSNMPSMILRPYLPGDANQDGKVDINDLTKVLTNYGQSGTTWTQGDFNGDGKVDINDLTKVLTNYGQSLGLSAAGIAAVPEPSTVVLLAALLPAAALIGGRCRGRKSCGIKNTLFPFERR